MIEGEELGKMMGHYPGILKNAQDFRDFPDYRAPGDIEKFGELSGFPGLRGTRGQSAED